MGNVIGTVNRYERDSLGLAAPEWEMLTKLVEAYPEAVPYDACLTLSNGEVASRDRTGSICHQVRRTLGQGMVTTVFRRGYRAGPALIAMFREWEDAPSSSEIHPAVPAMEEPTEPPKTSLRQGRDHRWQAGVPHRGLGHTVMSQMERACLEAVGL